LFVLFLLVIVLSVLRFTASDYSFGIFTRFVIALFVIWFTASDYSFGILWSLCCLSFDLRLLITSLVSFGHCVVCRSLIYGFWLPLWYFLAVVLSVLLRFTDSDYLFGIFWPLCCQSFFDLRILITSLVSFDHCVVCSFSIYGFWLPLWYLLAIVLSVLLWFTDSDYLFDIFWPLYCLSFFDLRILITSLVTFGHCVVSPSSIYGFWLPLWYLCVVCPPSIYGFWLPLWYLLARPKDTKEVIRIRKSKEDRQHKDTKEVIRIRKSKKDRQHNGQKLPKR
jgi:hypothetical protein